MNNPINPKNSYKNLWESSLDLNTVKRYSRQIVVPKVGVKGQAGISKAKVLVVGAGGLGSPVISYLAMAGVGMLGIADYDRVEIHNLQRQSIHNERKIGEYKTRSAVEYVRNVNGSIKTKEYCVVVGTSNVIEIIQEYDVVIDCSDQVGVRYVLNDACRIMRKDLVCGSVLRWEGQVFVIYNGGSCFRCMFPEAKESAANCDSSGVIGPMCGLVGSMQAVEVLKMIFARLDGSATESKIIICNGYTNEQSVFTRRYERCVLCKECEGYEKNQSHSGNTGQDYSNIIRSCGIKYGGNDSCSNACVNEGGFEITWNELLSCRNDYVKFDIRRAVHQDMFRVKGFQALDINLNRNVLLERLRTWHKPVVIACYRGNTSLSLVRWLNENGVKAWSVKGGIEEFKRMVELER